MLRSVPRRTYGQQNGCVSATRRRAVVMLLTPPRLADDRQQCLSELRGEALVTGVREVPQVGERRDTVGESPGGVDEERARFFRQRAQSEAERVVSRSDGVPRAQRAEGRGLETSLQSALTGLLEQRGLK